MESGNKYNWRKSEDHVMKGLVSHDRKLALYPKDNGRPFHDLFCLLERSLWLITKGQGDYREVWQKSK